MKNKITFIALLLCWLMSAGALASPIYSQLVVLGDSFSDSGNNAALFDKFLGGARTSVPLPASDIIPYAPYPSNRYSNGPVWVEQLADELGLSAQASLLGGTNYAYGGARVGQPVSPTLRLSLPSQAAQFLTDTGDKASSDSLYVIEGGGNDARDALEAMVVGNLAAVDQIIDAFTTNITTIVKDLSRAGAT
ncbi:MAG: SGNH/GDSL hydrolase family protein, partial [Nitrosospira sp.]|nr:SGNH/GDSL hydrolase family protein [Nitrosospira sp.]